MSIILAIIFDVHYGANEPPRKGSERVCEGMEKRGALGGQVVRLRDSLYSFQYVVCEVQVMS